MIILRFASLGLSTLLAATLAAQPVRRIPVGPANATLATEFVGITSVREIAGGRVLVTDAREQQLYVADFLSQHAEKLGRKGKGPGEWSNLGVVLATVADSSIIGDPTNRRWLLLHGAKIVGEVPTDHPAVQATEGVVTDVDRMGRVLVTRAPPLRSGTTVFTRADSSALVLVNQKSGRADTVAKVRMMPYRREHVVDVDGRVQYSMGFATEPNALAESARLFPDGWVAVVRLESLRVDWRSPTGLWTYGNALPLREERVDEAERRAIQARYDEARAQARRNGWPEPVPPVFPATLPITTRDPGLATSDGRLLLLRRASASNPSTRYLVINRRGEIDGEIVMGARESIVGFGVRTLYIAFRDADDIQFLRRHPWP